MKFRLKIVAASLLSLILNNAVAQNTANEHGFISPLNIPIQLSGNYGELRTNHFHSGLDIRVGGVAGEPVKAMADGYISRIFVSPYGYGKALYVAHPNGYTTVYAHLDRFNTTLTNYTLERQYSRESFNVDLYPDAGVLKVKQGDVIGYAGNSGSSVGAHLHLDVRNSANAVPLNILANGFLKVQDNIAPVVVNLYRVEIDTLCGVERHRVTATYTTVKTSGNNYKVKEVDRINIRRGGYFAVEVMGRKNANSFSMGAYSIEQRVDSEQNFGIKLDKISFANTRYSNAVGLYPLTKTKKNDVYALMRLDGNKLPIYNNVVNRGVIDCQKGQTKDVEIVVEDDCGNSSTLSFKIYGYPYSDSELEAQATENKAYVQNTYGTDKPFVAHVGKELSFQYDGMRVTIPDNALYKSMLVDAQISAQDERSLSPYYTIGTADEPLHKAITVSLDCAGLEHHGSKLRVAMVNANGKLGSVGGTIKGSRIEFTTLTFGKFTLVTDDTAPNITPKWNAAESQASKKTISFTISDDFSGVASFRAKIDGKWAMFDYDAKNSIITHTFDSSRFSYNGSSHKIELEVKDGSGNTQTYNGSFIR